MYLNTLRNFEVLKPYVNNVYEQQTHNIIRLVMRISKKSLQKTKKSRLSLKL